MSISYNKSIPVVFLVQEGDELPRAATEEDFLRAGYVPAATRGKDDSAAAASENPAPCFFDGVEAKKDEDCPLTCEECLFLGENHVLVELTTIPELIGDVLKDTAKVLRLDDFKGHVDGLLDPFKFVIPEEKAQPENSAPKAKSSSIEDIAGDLFTGAFNVFNSVKDGLSGLLEPVEYIETEKPSTDEKATPAEPVTPEPVKEEVKAEEEFSAFEKTVIAQFEELGLGEDAKAALRKSKEFSDFLSSNKPTPEQAKAFADLLKNGKPPFFGG
jgi:hypothetical protein